MRRSYRSAFTLIELLVVIAIIAILAVVVVLVLNPAALLQQSRDSQRLSDAATIKNAIGIYTEDVGGNMGSSSVVYISIPDPSATTTAGSQCQGLNLNSIGGGIYHCAASSSYRNVNGLGWIPINFASTSVGSPISDLPIDPVNATTSGYFYTYETNGIQYEITMALESSKNAMTEASDGGLYPDLYEQGTSLTLAPADFYAVATSPPPGNFNGFAYERKIAVTASTSIASGTLSNFPMLVSGSVSSWEPSSTGAISKIFVPRRMATRSRAISPFLLPAPVPALSTMKRKVMPPPRERSMIG